VISRNCVFSRTYIKRLFVSRFRRMHSLSTPKGLCSRPWSSLKSRRGDESCRRNHNSDRLADDPFPSISKGLSVAPPSSDVIRSSYPAFLQKGSFFNLPDFLAQSATDLIADGSRAKTQSTIMLATA
jgi:hypothetical protein